MAAAISTVQVFELPTEPTALDFQIKKSEGNYQFYKGFGILTACRLALASGDFRAAEASEIVFALEAAQGILGEYLDEQGLVLATLPIQIDHFELKKRAAQKA